MNIRALVRRIRAEVIDLVYPRRTVCLCCRECSDGNILCAECMAKLDKLRCRNVRLNGAKMHIEAVESRAVWKYRDEAGQLVRQLKFYCVRDAAEVMADAIAAEAREMHLPENTVVTSVAMPPKRVRQRGIDHGGLLAETVARRLELPYRELLSRAPGGHTQRGLKREQRMSNLSGRFTPVPMQGEPVLLVDDVLTTGATAAVCTRALLDAGSGPVWVITATYATKG